MTKYVFEVKYGQTWQEQEEETSGCVRVAVDKCDAQLAVDKVKAMAMVEESDFLMSDGETFAKSTGFALTSVTYETDYEE